MTNPPEREPTTHREPAPAPDDRVRAERADRERVRAEGADRDRVGTDPDRGRADRERVRALLDLHEGRGSVRVLDDAGIADVLRRARRIAVVGASPRHSRPSHGVMATLIEAGYDVVPVRPAVSEILGRRCYPDLGAAVAAEGPVDIVDVFRAPDACPAHAREAVAVGAGCLWLQLGIVSWEAASIAAAAGIPVVMDRCTAIELRRIPR